MGMKKRIAVLLAAAMLLALTACGQTGSRADGEESLSGTQAQKISLWTYPVGRWADREAVKRLTDAFTLQTGIQVEVLSVSYENGDAIVASALEAGIGPDLILEGPERLTADWGRQGYLVDLSGMLDDADRGEIYDSVLATCSDGQGRLFEYPLAMTAHCMAINLDAFKAAGADRYLDLERRTWSTQDFISAVEALRAHFGGPVGAVYCGGQAGDQGTRALVTNLYGGAFTDPGHTQYTWSSPENKQALDTLLHMGGIVFDWSLQGGGEIEKFYNEELKLAFCWNVGQQLDPNRAGTGEGKTVNGQEIVYMTFPTQSGAPSLQGGIWGLGIVDNGDEGRIRSAKEFVEYICDSEHTVDAVKTASAFAVRDRAGEVQLSNIWSDNPSMSRYQTLMPYLGDYYQVTPGWSHARTLWWTMLQSLGATLDLSVVDEYCGQANAAAKLLG